MMTDRGLLAKRVFWTAVVVALVGVLGTCGSPKSELPLGEQYPGPWVSDFHLGIVNALVSASVGGCGEFKYRQHYSADGEYLVHCTRDGSTWTAYFVWVHSGKVAGPFAPGIQD